MLQLGLGLALELGDDPHRQRLAQLDPPLVEGVELPDHALGEHQVLVQRHQAAQRVRRELLGEDHVGRAVALHHPVGDDVIGRALGADLLLGLAERQRLGLGEHVRDQQVVMVAQRVQRLGERDQVDRDQPRALVDQLVEAVLAVGPGLAPVDRAGVVVDVAAVERDVLAVGLHRQLLEVGREALEVLLVGHHADGLGAEEVRVPDARACPSASAGSARTARSGSARRPRGSRPASRGSARGRSASIVESPIAESIE